MSAIRNVLARANGHRGAGRLKQAIARDPAYTRSETDRYEVIPFTARTADAMIRQHPPRTAER